MTRKFSYRDADLYSHHTIDENPTQKDFSMHAHEWMEIFYFLSGKGSYLIEGTPYPLEPHDIIILRSAESHRLIISPDVPYERITIHFSTALLEKIDPEGKLLRAFLERPLGQMNRYPAAEDPKGRLRAAFANFDFSGIPDVRFNLMGRLLMFLSELDGIYEQTGKEQSEQGIPGQVVAYVNRHLFDDISVQSVADRFYRSRSQISRIFRQATGTSLWEYVTLKRLFAARAMIQRGETAGDAAIACGFSDYSAFFRAYRAHFGHIPREDSPKK